MTESIDPAARESGDGGGGNQDNRDAIIKRLQGERDKARQRWQETQSQLGTLAERLANIEGRVSASGGGDAPEENGSLLKGAPTEMLEKALQKGIEGSDPSLQFESLQEMIRRTVESAVGELPGKVKSSLNMDDHRARVVANIEEGYKEMLDPDSQEFAQASAYTSRLRQTYGKDVLEKYPELYELALLKVQQAQLPRLRESLHERDKKLEELQRQLTTAIDGGGAPPLHDAARAALERKDTKGAISAITSRLLGG